MSRSVFLDTSGWLAAYHDHRFSLADAVSFEVMRKERIAEAFALDHHFEVVGYKLLPAPPHRRKRAKQR